MFTTQNLHMYEMVETNYGVKLIIISQIRVKIVFSSNEEEALYGYDENNEDVRSNI